MVGTWDEAQPVRVSLSRALVDGDTAFAAVGRDDVDPPFSSMRMQPAVACSTAPGPGGTPPRPGQPGATPKVMRLAAALRLPGAALARARLRARIALPVRLPERGRIALRVRAKGRTLARGSTSTSKVTLKVTAAGRATPEARGEGDAGRDVQTRARRGQAPACEREGDPQGVVVERAWRRVGLDVEGSGVPATSSGETRHVRGRGGVSQRLVQAPCIRVREHPHWSA